MVEQKTERLAQSLFEIRELQKELQSVSSLEDKELILNGLSAVKCFLSNRALGALSLEERVVVKSCMAIGQWREEKSFVNLPYLKLVHDFFRLWEGLIGYQEIILSSLVPQVEVADRHLLQAPGLDITHESPDLYAAIFEGLVAQKKAAELWPVGGAGDRLGLVDGYSGEPLPAALLSFCGYNLLEGLVRDLFAREWLYYKVSGRQLTTPVGLMTSLEKNNHNHIVRLFEGSSFYGRPKESLRCFMQPLVPVIDKNGHWQYDDSGYLKMKPGGHGVIWKLAADHHILSWFKESERQVLLVRQINNPIAATDYGLIALLGYGASQQKKFGFLSCQRAVGSAEGMNILIEKEREGHFSYAISNVEYTEFAKFGLKDTPEGPNSPYSIYPSNTNILFASIDAIEEAVKNDPLPGPLLNFKGDPPLARLETMMQNIAEEIHVDSPTKMSNDELAKVLPSFILYGERRKTISVTKNPVNPEKTIAETPLGALYDSFANMVELFKEHCHFTMPSMPSREDFVATGASVAVILHPAIGPLWSVIAQKIRHGILQANAEMILDIEAVDMENLSLNGSLVVYAKEPLGSIDEQGHIIFSEKRGRARFYNVTIHNESLVRPLKEFMQRPLERRGLVILLEGFSEIAVYDTHFTEEEEIIVPHGYKLTIDKGERRLEELREPSWQWHYAVSGNILSLDLDENRLSHQTSLS